MKRLKAILFGVVFFACQAQAQTSPFDVAQENLNRACTERMESLKLGTPDGELPVSLGGLTCRDLGYDAADLPSPAKLSTENRMAQRSLRECLTAVSALASQLEFSPFKAKVHEKPCPGVANAAIRSTLVFVQGPTVNDFTVTLVDAQGVRYRAGPDTRFPVPSSKELTERQKQFALRDGARAIYYACLVKLEETRQGSSLPERLDGASCADLGVDMHGTQGVIHLYPWTPEKYQFTFINLEGQTRRYPDKTMPTCQQAQAQAIVRAVVQGGLLALVLAPLVLALTLIPSVPFLRGLGVIVGLLASALFLPALRYQAIDYADGLVQFAIVGVAGLGFCLLLPRRVCWERKEKWWASFGFSFALAGMLTVPLIALMFALAGLGGQQGLEPWAGLLVVPVASLITAGIIWYGRKTYK